MAGIALLLGQMPLRGVVAKWLYKKGVGFIRPEDGGADHLFHISVVHPGGAFGDSEGVAGCLRLKAGDEVEYELKVDPKNPQGREVASKVTLLGGGPSLAENSHGRSQKGRGRGRGRNQGAALVQLSQGDGSCREGADDSTILDVDAGSAGSNASMALAAGSSGDKSSRRRVHASLDLDTAWIPRTFASLDVVAPVALLAGPCAARILRVTSQDFHRSVAKVLPSVLAVCPSSLYVCGGANAGGLLSSVERLTILAEVEPGGGDTSICFVPAGNSSSGSSFSGGPIGAATAAVGSSARRPPAWEVLPPMLQKRYGCAAASIFGKLYIVGGWTEGNLEEEDIEGEMAEAVLADAECYDPNTCTWQSLPPMICARARPVCANIGGKLYVCGGESATAPLKSAERFDPEAAVWEALPDMWEHRQGAVAAALQGRLYVCGGFDGVNDLRTMEAFDPAVNSWDRELPSMRECRHGGVAGVVAGRLLVCGGFHYARMGRAEAFDPTTHIWASSPALPGFRRGPAAAVAAGRLFVVGGQDGFWEGSSPLQSGLVFDPRSLWAIIPGMNEDRRGAALASVVS